MTEVRKQELRNLPRAVYAASMVLLQQRGFNANTFLDIGAAEGAFFLLRQSLKLLPAARHFFIDAMQENEATYRRIAAKFGTGHEITALSCIEGETVVRIDPHSYNTHIGHVQEGATHESMRRVPVNTLDSVVERHALQPPFALKLDVQGSELDVLRGSLRTLAQAVMVTAEIQIFSERDTLVELLGFMQGAGWALYDISDLAYYPANNTFYQCYATFIPKPMDFRKGLAWCESGQLTSMMEHLRLRRETALKAIDELIGPA